MSNPGEPPRKIGVLTAGAVAATVGAAIWSVASAWFDEYASLHRFFGMTVLWALIGMIVAGLAAPQIARWTIRGKPLGWGNAALTGMMTATLPTLALLLAKLPVTYLHEEPLLIGAWLTGIATVAVAGTVAGLVFRALYGGREIGR